MRGKLQPPLFLKGIVKITLRSNTGRIHVIQNEMFHCLNRFIAEYLG